MLQFSLLLLFSACLSPAVCFVPAPSDVRVRCKNFTNIIYWNYSEPHLQPVFIVEVKRYTRVESVILQTNETFLDVSEYTNDSDEGYFVSVEAVLKGSDRSLPETFQFSYDKQYFGNPCVVDFPPLNLTVFPNKIDVTFINPIYLFENIPAEDFSFNIRYNETEAEFVCSNDEMLCIVEINIHDSLYGRCINLSLEGTNLRTSVTREVCGEGIESDKRDFTTLITSVVCVIFAILILIVVGVAFFKRLLKQDSYSPILSKLLQGHQTNHAVNIPEHPALSSVLSVSDTNLLVTSDPVSPSPISPASDEVTHLPINFHLTPEEQEHEDMTEDEDSDGTTNSFSGYDRSKFTIDIGHGDLVDAYGKRGP